MANPTTNFGWVMPTSSSLVTNLPADFNTFGQGVDTSLQYLLGGTTGQVLSKTSGTNMAFTWVTPTDQTPLTTKGDLFTFTTVDARLAVGNNGETLVADSSTSTGLRYQGNFAAGKNKIINGDFGVWQRGTSFAVPGNTGAYTADRWAFNYSAAMTTHTVSQQTFTPGTAPVAGYEGTFYLRSVITTPASATVCVLNTKLEDVRLFAGQTMTFSFWAKNDSSRTFSADFTQNFGSGGSGNVATSITLTGGTVGTSWTRVTGTLTVPSISGKTIGTSSYVQLGINLPVAAGATSEIWGVQAEISSVATAFQTATGSIQGETSACQRYYYKSPEMSVVPGAATFSGLVRGGTNSSGNRWVGAFSLPVTMRTSPTCVVYNPSTGSAGSMRNEDASTNVTVSGIFGQYTNTVTQIDFSPSTSANNVVVGYITASAEL